MSEDQKSNPETTDPTLPETPKASATTKASKAAAAASKSSEAADGAPAKKRVKSLVNMTCHDGTEMVAGQHVELSHEEFQRIAQRQARPGAQKLIVKPDAE